jgi:PadR family transcriptional regulator, regulatory protein AphA
MARVSRTPFVILGILGIAGRKPLSGYDLKQVIDGTISHFWSESYGQIYPVLKQMAAAKLITARAIRENGRKRTVYTITARGRKSLGAWLERPPEQGPMRDELILKLFFGDQTDVPVLIRHLQGYRDRLKAAHEQYATWLKQAEGQNEAYTAYQIMTLRGGIAMCEAFVQWADESLATLSQMRSAK